MLAAVSLDLLDRGAADAACRRVDDAQQAHRIDVGGRQLQVSHQVLDLGALIETETADDVVLASVAAQGFLDLPGLRVGAVEHRRVVLRVGGQVLFDGVGDEQRLVLGIEPRVEADALPRGGFGPEFLALARLVVLHHGAGRRQDVLRRAVVLLQPDGAGLGKIALEIQDVADIGAPPAIDRLILVAHHADVAVPFRKQAHQFVLAAVGVLVLVHHDVAQPPVPGLARGVVGAQKAHGFEQQVVEIQGVGVSQGLLVLFENRGDGLALLVHRLFEKIGRRQVAVLGVADAREDRAILQELLLVQSQRAVAGLDDTELVVVVVDGEAPRETGAHAGQRIAVAAQEPHAKRVEGGDVGRGIQRNVLQQTGYPPAHLIGGLVGESHRQDGGRRHAPRGNDVRDAMGDNPGLPAARTRQDQKRPLGVTHRLPLAGV